MDAGRQMKTENHNKSNKQNYFQKIFSSKKITKKVIYHATRRQPC